MKNIRNTIVISFATNKVIPSPLLYKVKDALLAQLETIDESGIKYGNLEIKTSAFKDDDASLEGRSIKGVRAMTPAEKKEFDWEVHGYGQGDPIVLELDGGLLIFASRDEEMNGPGELCVRTKDGKIITFFMPAKPEGR